VDQEEEAGPVPRARRQMLIPLGGVLWGFRFYYLS